MLAVTGTFQGMPNLSTVLAPLHKLLAGTAHYQWNQTQQDAFNIVKSQLASSKVLVVHYDNDIYRFSIIM